MEPGIDANIFIENQTERVRVASSSGQIRQDTIAAQDEPSRANFVETQNSGLVQELRAQISQTIREKDEAIKEKEMAINSERHKDELIKQLSDKNNELSDIVKFQECHSLDLHRELGEKDKALEAERAKSQSLEAALSEFRRIVNELYVDEPSLETPTREVHPTIPAEYKRLQSSVPSAACNETPREGPTGKQATSSPDPSTKVLSKGAAEKHPASWSALNTLAPSDGTFVNQSASKSDSGSADPSSDKRPRSPGMFIAHKKKCPWPGGRHVKLRPLRWVLTMLKGGARVLEVNLNVTSRLTLAMRFSFIPTAGTKTANRTAAQNPFRAHQQASDSRQHTRNLEVGMAGVARVTSLLKEVQLSENEKTEVLKEAATKQAETEARKPQTSQAIFDAVKMRLEALSKPVSGDGANATPGSLHGFENSTHVARLPSLEFRETIWNSLQMLPESPQGPTFGFFEGTLSSWIDFHDLNFGARGSMVTKLWVGLYVGFLEDLRILEIVVNLRLDFGNPRLPDRSHGKAHYRPCPVFGNRRGEKGKLDRLNTKGLTMLKYPGTSPLPHLWVHVCWENRDEMKECVGVVKYGWSLYDYVDAFVWQC
ncbi:hypothetical protein FPANT_13199 [Fusarium pseudoanthophilum]|uniref:Uncharacterized protein n=1 Tax=Fusarium pseudoanthophilum TaxID=48495 RepID=A0A8H5KEC1_9HYPO|nr:hypothetical protein FPANT_13199 [Fusarium pseudoanthophilum]